MKTCKKLKAIQASPVPSKRLDRAIANSYNPALLTPCLLISAMILAASATGCGVLTVRLVGLFAELARMPPIALNLEEMSLTNPVSCDIELLTPALLP